MASTGNGTDRYAIAIARFFPWAVLGFLALFAVRFADERLYSDSGYYLARVINEGTFRIEHGRWVLALSQVLPLVGVKLGLGMKALIVLHSLNNAVWLCACMLFAGRVLRDGDAVIALAAVHLIGLTHGLFCPIFELYYGADLLILFLAVNRCEGLAPAWRWLLLITLFTGAITSHFLGLFLAFGAIALEEAWSNRKLLVVLFALTVVMLIVRFLTLSVYEQSGLEFLADLRDPQKLLALFALDRMMEFAGYLAIHYADLSILALAATTMLWRSGERRSVLVLLGGLFVLHVLAGLFLPGFIHDRYREQVNFATTAWVLLVIALRLLPLARWRTITLAMLAAAGLFRMVRAEWIAPWYTERTALTKARIDAARERGASKGIVQAPVYFGPPHHLIDLSWSTSVESLLLSATNGPEGTVSLITTEDLELPEVRAQLDRFIFRRWDIMDPSWLDQRYFRAPTGRYTPAPAGSSAMSTRSTGRWLDRLTVVLAILVMAFLAQFAWRFAEERLYADSGYYLFRTINEGGFHIEHGRWVLAFAEWLPLLGAKLGLPLRSVITLHSLSSVVFLLFAIGFAGFVLHDRRTVLALAVVQLVGLAHGLFCPVFELYYGVGLIILFHATAVHDKLEGRTRIILACLLFIVALSSHPMAWLLLFGSIMLLDHRQRRPILVPLGICAIMFAAMRFSSMSTYEAAQLSFAQRIAFPSLVFGLFRPGVIAEQAGHTWLHYPDVIVLAVLCMVVLWKDRRAVQLFASGMLVLYVLVGLYLPDLRHDRYREQVDFGFAAWTILVLLYRAWDQASWRWAIVLLIAFCGAYRMVEAERVAPFYAKRTQWHLDRIAEARAQGLSKAIVDPGNIEFGTMDDRVTLYWSTGVESLLLSAKDGPQKAVSIITKDDALCVPQDVDPGTVVLRCADVLGPEEVDGRYFAPTPGAYAPPGEGR
ncbi:MAG: hypothetical protein IPL52_12275 [Flavobacteriales bacterium]|nr:hypothetical protein [Flavobacteriales bacterium]